MSVKPTLTLFLLVALLAACTRQPDPSNAGADSSVAVRADTLTGTVVYRERIALPPDAVVRVTLEDVSRADAPSTVLAEQTIATDGRQAPISFALGYDPDAVTPNGRYVVRATISHDGQLYWTSDTAHPVLTDDAPNDEVIVRVRQAADGEAEPEGSQAIWTEARRRGATFRAVGNEPGWHLELLEDRIRFVYAYGQEEAVTPRPEPTRSEGRTVYHAETEAHTLTVTIEDAACTDTMSGEAFEATVTVELDGATYRGCGRSLAP